MRVHKIEKPDTSGIHIEKVLERVGRPVELSGLLARTNMPAYLYWDKIKYLPRPEKMSAQEFWVLIKFVRENFTQRVKSVVRSESGKYFSWQSLPGQERSFHEIDMHLGGSLTSSQGLDKDEKYQFISRGIMEEAIASSQLEGANTTRKAAKRLLREKRKPRNHSEQMILNNYQAMLAIEDEHKRSKLDMDLLLHLHTIITEETIDEGSVGRLRTDTDDVVVVGSSDGLIYHIPPKEQFMKQELDRFLAYANDELNDSQFIHPLLKAIILHFWVGYLHPFTDGNGRLARALFYWYLLRNDYWAFTYLPLSRVIKNSPAQYRDAYAYTEQDDNDLTYFIDYNLRKIKQAKRDFDSYVERRRSENKKMTGIARSQYQLNDRQIQLLRYYHKNSEECTSIKTYANIYRISRLTARKDLKRLEELGFIVSKKIGREVPFFATDKIAELFN